MVADRALTPDDAAVALRSFPRRFRAVFARPDDDEDRFDPDQVARRPGTDGVTAAEHLAAATELVVATGAVARSLDATALPDATSDDGRPIAELLGAFDVASTDAAERVSAVASGDWTTGPLHTVQDAIGAVGVRLRQAEATLRSVR
ncbi:MAG: hypothetical protein OSA99_03150 [Acidimicrobiales bacterium]|nr:hypothetical protein [Acidimicrobiales bacterium]